MFERRKISDYRRTQPWRQPVFQLSIAHTKLFLVQDDSVSPFSQCTFFPPAIQRSTSRGSHFHTFSSVQFSCSVVSNSLRPHGLQHSRLPCPSPTPGVYPNSCPLSRWCHPTISSPIVPFFSRLQSFPASGSFQMSQLFTWGGQRLEFQLQHQSF